MISGSDGDDVLIGGAGNDTIYGLSGKDTIEGGEGDDLIEVDLGSDTQKADNLDGGPGTDTVSVDLSNQTVDITFDSTNPIAEQTFADGARVANFEVFKNIKTGSGNDRLVQLGDVDNSFSTGAGDDTVNTGLGYDFAHGGEGNDLLIVDYSVNDSGGGMYGYGGQNSYGGQFTRYNGTGQLVDQVNHDGFERFQVTGTPYADVISGSDGDDVLIGGGGADSLTGDPGDINEVGNDTYILDATNAAGSSIQDFGGTDSLILENAQIALVKAQPGKMGLGRLNTSLIVDLNQDGVLNPNTDLSIVNFYVDRFTNTIGFGFLESVGNVSGNDVLALKLLDSNVVDMGTLNSIPKTYNDFVGSTDTEDSYIFNLNADGQVNLSINNSNVNMTLTYASPAGLNVIATGQSIQTNLFAGNYIIILSGLEDNNYSLEASANSILDQAGNSLGNARNLGFLVGSQTFSDFVGNIDPVDFYRFELSKPSTFNFSGSNNIAISLLDRQGNQIINPPTELEAATYYIKVDSYGYNTNYNLNLEAIPSTTPVPLQILEISPDAGSNGGTTTITVEGTQFTPDAKLTLIATDGTVREASQVTWYDNTTLAGTFNLQGLATGVYDVRIEDTAGTVISNDVFTVNSQPVSINPLFNNNNIELSLVVPGSVRPWWTGEVTVTYRNTGNSDITAPLLTLSADKAKMRLDGEQEFDSNSLQFLAGGSDAVTGVLSPGETGSFTALFLPNPTSTNTQINFSVDKAKLYEEIFLGGGSSSGGSVSPPEPIYEPITFDWESIKPTLKPESISDDAWDIIWSNFTNSVGTEVSQYQAVLTENANYLSQLGETTNDVSRLLGFELLQANNFGSIAQRFELGVLGRGWVFPFSYSLTVDSDGNVSIKAPDKSGVFELQPDASYLGPQGCECTLTKVGDTYHVGEPDGSTLVFTADGKLDYIDDVNGNRTELTYTGDRLTQVSYTNSDSLTFDYNAQGRVSKVTDQAGRITTYGYDAIGEHLLTITTPDGTTSYSYITTTGASQHAISSITYADGSQSLFEYDSQGRLISQSLNGGAEAITYSYDSTGGVTITDANGAVTKQFLNDRGQIARVIDPLNRTLNYRYDSDGNLTQIVAPGDSISSFNYDSEGNLLSSSDPLGHRVDFTYEPNFDQLATVRDQKGNLTSYSYDAKGNLTQLTYADGSSETFGYDSKGNLTVSANRRGQTITYTYDAKFQLISKEYPDGSSATFTYDSRGNLLTAIDGDSSTTFEYDNADRLTKVTDGDGRFVAYSYDTAGRRTQMADNLGNTVNYSYDAVGRLSSLKDGSNNLIASYTYDAIGSLSRSDNGNGTYTTYSYDAAGQLLDLVNYKADNTVNSRFDYTYDVLGRRTSMTTLEGTTNYGYDATGQLTSVSLPTGRTIQYQYDAAGNRIAVTDNGTATNYSTNNLNQYTSVGGATYLYDTDGNLISKTEGGNTSTYAYDAENRLISVTTADGTWNYEYDALGNRIATVHNGQRTEYLLDPSGLGNVVGEFDQDGNLVANYVHGLGLESRNGGGVNSFYDFDAIGSVAGLTGNTGTYLNQYSYLPFGENLTTTESVANPFEYVGQWGVMDEGNGLDFMRARFYSPNLGQFLTEDPARIETNLRRYAVNAPLLFTDPSGLSCETPVKTKSQVILDGLLGVLGGFAEAATGIAAAGPTFGTSGLLVVHGAYTMGVGIGNIVNVLTGGSTDKILSGGGFEDLGRLRDWVGGFGETFQTQGQILDFLFGVLVQPTKGISHIVSSVSRYRYAVAKDWWDLLTVVGAAKTTNQSLQSITKCINSPPTPNTPGPNSPVPVVVSRDPNDVVGPAGFGTQGWLTPNQTLPYAIRFENAEDAGAAAVFVTVTQQLDPDLDWNTFQLGDFGFGNFYIDVPDGFQNYSTRVDARNTIGYFVDFAANLNQATGQVTYTLTTIDPFTGQLPTDVNAGFLPPNDDTHDGEGFVGYKIEAKPNLTTGTELSAEASIVFDVNDPINTPVHLNTVDQDAPSSSVSPLPATTTTDTFTVSWIGNDVGSGIASYNIYVSVDGGEFGLLLDDTTDTSATFAAEAGKTYAFYSVATDNVGRRENLPATADAITTIAGQSNNPPITQANKSLTVDEDANPTALNITAPTDADGDPLTITVNTIPDPSKGTIYTDRAWLQTDPSTGFNVFALDTVLGLAGYPTDSLLNYGSVGGSVITTEITVKAGDTLSFAWNFLTNELIDPNLTQNDFAFFTVVPTVSPITPTVNQLADTTSTFVPSTTMSFQAETGFNTETVTFTSAGTFTLGFGVVDVGDFAGASGLLVDNITLAGQSKGIALTAGTSLTLDQLTKLFFVPVANANGAAGTFSYSVSDGNGGTASQIVTLDITPVNDNPTVSAALTSTKSEDDSPSRGDKATKRLAG